jgi:hypothetical protein
MLGLALGCLTTLQKRDSQKRLLHSPNGCPSQSDGRGKRHERANDKTGTLSLRYRAVPYRESCTRSFDALICRHNTTDPHGSGAKGKGAFVGLRLLWAPLERTGRSFGPFQSALARTSEDILTRRWPHKHDDFLAGHDIDALLPRSLIAFVRSEKLTLTLPERTTQ